MIILITSITIVLYVILIVFTFHNLKFVPDAKFKIIYIAIGLAIMFIVTLIIFNISSNGINYENSEITSQVRNILLAVFVPVNGIITMPYLAHLLGKTNNNEITKESFKKRCILLIIIFVLIIVFECSYFNSTQQGIVNMINQK